MVMHLAGFYLNQSLFVPKLLFKRKFLLYGISLSALVLTVFISTNVIQGYLFGPMKPELIGMSPVLIPPNFATAGLVLLMALGVAAKASQKWLEQEKQHEQVKNEQIQTELAFLKNQISPHFFFNTLNNICALIDGKPQKAQDITHKLSKLMRYLLYESDKQKVTLGREISFLTTYIDLMRVRLPETVNIHFDHGSKMDNTEIL